MNVQLAEEIIRSRASDQSYQKGRDYYPSVGVAALRAAVIFQVGEGAARPFIEALARFEQAEMLRWRGQNLAEKE
jgi:hypothetical protein